jgi:spore maturation protein CgeB
MRILIVGSATQWTLADSYVRAFTQLGIRTTLFDHYLEVARFARARKSRATRAAAWSLGRRTSAVQLLRAVSDERPDLVFFIKCDDMPSWLYPILRRLTPKTKLAVFHPDDPFRRGLPWRYAPSHRRSIVQMRSVDHYFVWSNSLVERARTAGARSASYLGFAVDPDFCFPDESTARSRERFAADVSFVGNWDPRREAWLEPLARTGVALAIWGGPDWEKRCVSALLRNAWRGDFAVGADFRRAVIGGRLSINILREQNREAENMRTYEIPACGAVMIGDYSPTSERLFPHGKCAFYAGTPQGLADQLKGWLADEERLALMRTAALQASSQQLYVNRAVEIVERLFGVSSELRAYAATPYHRVVGGVRKGRR